MKSSAQTELSSPGKQEHGPLVSAVLAYFCSYVLLECVGTLKLSDPASHREFCFFSGLMLIWAILETMGGTVPLAGQTFEFSVASNFWKYLFFLGILGGFYACRVVPDRLLIFVLVGSLLYTPISFAMRYVALHLGRAGRLIQHDSQILVIGSKDQAREAVAAIQGAGEEYEIIGCLDPDPSRIGARVGDCRVLGSTEELPKYLFGDTVDLILFALPLELVPNVTEAISKAMEVGIPVSVAMECGLHRLSQCVASSQTLSYKTFSKLPTVILSNVPGDSAYLVLKRVLDIVISAILLLVLSPLFLLTAALIKLTSPDGPVFYQWRVLGRNRKPFVGYKFRTMVPNAEQLKEQLLQHNEMQGPVFKIKSDPRVTPLGRILRKYSIDELPQLYSVLIGDMSLVGPRPPAKHEADQFAFWQRRKLSVKPGITCLWQVNGRSEIANFDEWARLDIEYINRASMSADLRILLRTIPAVVRGKGAH
jgi:exopolysaccharide biosynthesis polyprenyl glycosylphosphotransferase